MSASTASRWDVKLGCAACYQPQFYSIYAVPFPLLGYQPQCAPLSKRESRPSTSAIHTPRCRKLSAVLVRPSSRRTPAPCCTNPGSEQWWRKNDLEARRGCGPFCVVKARPSFSGAGHPRCQHSGPAYVPLHPRFVRGWRCGRWNGVSGSGISSERIAPWGERVT